MLPSMSSSERRPVSSAVKMIARSRSGQSLRRRCCSAFPVAATSSLTTLWCSALGSVLVVLGRPTWGIGLAGMSSAVNR